MVSQSNKIFAFSIFLCKKHKKFSFHLELMSVDDEKTLDFERRHDRVFYTKIIRERLEPLMAYVEGGENAKLQLELGVNYLKITERDEHSKELRPPEIIKLTGSRTNFIRAYAFSSLLIRLYEKGDIAYDQRKNVLSVSREDLKEEIKSVFMERLGRRVAGTTLNHVSKSVIEKYDVFRIKENDADYIKLGYRLKENLHIVVTEKSISV